MKTIATISILAALAFSSAAAGQTTTVLPAGPSVGLGLAGGTGTSPVSTLTPVSTAVGAAGLPGLTSLAGGLPARKICIVNLGVQSAGRVAMIRNQVEAHNLRVECR